MTYFVTCSKIDDIKEEIAHEPYGFICPSYYLYNFYFSIIEQTKEAQLSIELRENNKKKHSQRKTFERRNFLERDARKRISTAMTQVPISKAILNKIIHGFDRNSKKTHTPQPAKATHTHTHTLQTD